MRYFSNLLKIIKQLLLSSILLVFGSGSALCAQEVVLKYSIWRETVPVEELRVLVDSGQASPRLERYLELINRQPQDLQKILNYPVPVEAVSLSKFLNSFVGELILDKVSEVVHTPQVEASRESLRGALVTAALKDGNNNVRLIEVLEAYPTPSVEVEGDRLAEVYRFLQKPF